MYEALFVPELRQAFWTRIVSGLERFAERVSRRSIAHVSTTAPPHVLSDGRDAREVVQSLWRSYEERIAQSPQMNAEERGGVLRDLYRDTLRSTKGNKVDGLKIKDAESDMLSVWRRQSGIQESHAERQGRLMRQHRQRNNYTHILTDDLAGIEREVQEWVARSYSFTTARSDRGK